MDYKQKYLKYKQKYMLLKQLGGACENIVKDVKKEVKIINLSLKFAKIDRLPADKLSEKDKLNNTDLEFMATLSGCELDRVYDYVMDPKNINHDLEHKHKFEVSKKISDVASIFGQVKSTPPKIDRSTKPIDPTLNNIVVNTQQDIQNIIASTKETTNAVLQEIGNLPSPEPSKEENKTPEDILKTTNPSQTPTVQTILTKAKTAPKNKVGLLRRFGRWFKSLF